MSIVQSSIAAIVGGIVTIEGRDRTISRKGCSVAPKLLLHTTGLRLGVLGCILGSWFDNGAASAISISTSSIVPSLSGIFMTLWPRIFSPLLSLAALRITCSFPVLWAPENVSRFDGALGSLAALLSSSSLATIQDCARGVLCINC